MNVRRYLETPDVEGVAAYFHAGQVDKSGVDYLDHLRTVSFAVAPFGATAVQVGLLHDVLEDTDATPEVLLENGVAPAVVRMVCHLTRPQDRELTYADWIAELADVTRYQPDEMVTLDVLHWLELPTDKPVPLVAVVKLADNASHCTPSRVAALDVATAKSLPRRYAKSREKLVPSVGVGVARVIYEAINPSLLAEIPEG